MYSNIASLSLDPAVRGFLHTPPPSPAGAALVLTHGAGGNCNSPFLVALAGALADAGMTVLRCNLPFRQARSFGPPRPGEAERDREGLLNAITEARKTGAKHIIVGGQSYGGRQASILCAEHHDVANGLLLLSYPLHPPGKPNQPRTQHLPNLRTPTLIVHGTTDPFGSVEEIDAAMKLIPANTRVVHIEGVGHDLGWSGKKRNQEALDQAVAGMKWLVSNADVRGHEVGRVR